MIPVSRDPRVRVFGLQSADAARNALAVMTGKVLLFSVNEYEFPYPVFPLGLMHVDAALRQAGYRTRLVDYNVNRQPLADIVKEFPPECVGISLRNIDDALIQKRETFFDGLKGLCEELRSLTKAPIVLGGSGFSIFPRELLVLSEADYGIQGEGERQFPALIRVLREGGELADVSGLVYRDGTEIRFNERRDLVEAGEIARPAAEPGLVSHYLEKSSMLNIQTQRGCALRCCYCTYPLLEGRRYRRRPAEAVVEEFRQAALLGARYVFVVDSVFNTSADHVADICEGLLRAAVQLKWCCFLRPKGLTSELMGLMARAGLMHVEFGADSFSDPVLKAYGKGLTFEDIQWSSELAVEHGVDYAHFLILGGPGETRETLSESFENSRRLKNAAIMARVGMRVYPGTPLHRFVLEERGADGLPDLLEPYYYVSPQLSEAEIFSRLRETSSTLSNWIFEDPPSSYFKMAERLRARGVIGPLWAYFSMIQRLGDAFGQMAPSPSKDRGRGG